MSLEMPKKIIRQKKKVEDLESIWHGNHINKVRKAHIEGKAGSINIYQSLSI